jgi:uncharacterized protein (DUF2147 family)
MRLLILGFFLAFQNPQHPLTGTWLTGNKLGKIEVSHKNGKYEARIIWLEVPEYEGKPATDRYNENPKLRNRALLGLNLFGDMKLNKDGKLVGPVYDPYRGKIFHCEIWLENKSKLNVRGYVGVFYQTKQWSRVD